MPIPLSRRTNQIASILFSEATRNRILEKLLQEASENIPFCEEYTSEQMDRIRFSIMKLVAQNPASEDYVFKLARVDWSSLSR